MGWKDILKEDLKNPPFKMAIDRVKPYTDIDEFTDSLFHMEKQTPYKKIYLVVKEVILGGPLPKDEIGGLYYHYTKKDRLTKPEARMLKTLIELNDSPILNEIVEYVNLREF